MGYIPLIEAQSRPHSMIYQMPAKEFATGAEALADSQAVRARLRPAVVSRYVRPRPAPTPVLLPPPEPIVPFHVRQRDYLAVMKQKPNDKGFCPEVIWRPILNEVMARHNVTELDLKTDIRPAHIVLARQEAYYRMRTELSISFANIGKILGGRDHTSVRHGYLKHKARLEAAAQ